MDNRGGKVLEERYTQWIDAGKGLLHLKKRRKRVLLIYAVVENLPAEAKMAEPRYQTSCIQNARPQAGRLR